jgi:hypothetical protein
MKKWASLCAVAMAVMSTSIQAQVPPSGPTESVTVTAPGEIPEKQARDFVKSFTAISPASGKIARWRMGICPAVTGLPPSGIRLVTGRVRQVAVMAGAPVGAPSCKPNTDIVFTLNPQVLLDNMRAKNRVLLGYHDASQEQELATVRHPIQAWYTTQTVDYHGNATVDDKLRTQGGSYTDTPFGRIFISEATVQQVTGSHLSDGRSSEILHAVIVIDLAKVTGRTVGALADYAAMLALAQTQSFEACAPVASITNLVSSGCAAAPVNEVTSADLAYLHALYSIDPRDSLGRQREEIASRMKAETRDH